MYLNQRILTMRKVPVLLTIMLFLWLTETVKAQLIKSMGLRTGLSYNLPGIQEKSIRKGITKNTSSDHNNQLFVFGELQTEWNLLYKQATLLTNLTYISKGYSEQVSSGGGYGGFSGGGSSNQYKFANYATISLLPKYTVDLDEHQFYGFAGPYLSFLFAANSTYYLRYYYNPTYFPYHTLYEYYKDHLKLKPMVWGGTIGIGTTFNTKGNRIKYNIQLQYLQDISWAADFYFEDPRGDHWDSYSFKAKNKTYLLSFGAQYLFKKHE